VKDNPSELKMDTSKVQATNALRPLKAIREHCSWCCNDSAHEVRLCAAKACAAWDFRFGRKPTAETGDRQVHPPQDGATTRGATALKAIKSRCLDCSGGSKSELRNCQHVTCDLHPFRLGTNPNRKMKPEQRRIAAARLKANVGAQRPQRRWTAKISRHTSGNKQLRPLAACSTPGLRAAPANRDARRRQSARNNNAPAPTHEARAL
jgi:hypothetical protein